MTGRMLSVTTVARMINKSSQWVRDAIECGELKAINMSLGKKRARWEIKPEDLREFFKNRENMG